MKSLKDYILEHLHINEGGNAVQADPIPAFIAPKVYEQIEQQLKKHASVEMAPLGSLGKKKDDDFTGDIDIAVNFKSKQELIEAVQKAFPDMDRNDETFPNIVSISYPYNIDGHNGNAQIDFMIVKDMNWAKFRYSSPDFKKGESKYKAAVRSQLCSIIVSEIPFEEAKEEYFEDGVTVKRKWKYTFNTEGVFKQLLDYTGKNGKPKKNPTKLKEFEELITNDPQNFIKFLFGEEGKLEDYTSAESLWKAIHDPKKFKWQDKVKTIEDRFFKECDKAKEEDFPRS